MITSLNAAAEPGPMSKPLAPSGRLVPNVANTPSASTPTMSSGRWIVLPPCSSSSRLQVSTWSGSNSESPIGLPCAAKNVKHIAPPMTSASTTPSNASTTPSLSEILAPPSTATNGRFGSLRRPRRTSTSFCQQQAHRRRQRLRRTDDRRVRAVRRTERVVDVEVDAVDQACATNAGSLASSPGSKRRFSISSTPGASSASRARTGVHRVLRVRARPSAGRGGSRTPPSHLAR